MKLLFLIAALMAATTFAPADETKPDPKAEEDPWAGDSQAQFLREEILSKVGKPKIDPKQTVYQRDVSRHFDARGSPRLRNEGDYVGLGQSRFCAD